MKRLLAIASIGLLWACSPRADVRENKIPDAAAHALANPSAVILYSLEPNAPRNQQPEFSGYRLLGKVELDPRRASQAIAAFRLAAAEWDHAVGVCFNPRHALRVVSGGKIYDFLLCYQCHQMQIVGDGAFVTIGAAGSPAVLNGLLEAENIPVSRSDDSQRTPERP
jgi:hypothetical protein